MSQLGWISIHRKLRECWLYDDKPYDRTHAWLDILLSANHQDKKILLGNQLITIEKGSFITSEVKLSDKWGWSRKKVRGFLEVLERDKMLAKKSTSKYTSLTIVNYGLYQNQGTTEDTSEEHQKNSTGTSKEHQKNTNNNDNNDNNENNDNKSISKGTSPTFKPPTVDEVKQYCKERNNNIDSEAFVNFYISKGWMIGKNKMKDWKAAIVTWEKKSRQQQPQKKISNEPSGKRQYDVDELEKQLLGRE